ncbi:protein of unknown function [Xenorhabdus doucetiae]|uniref:Uncharacterized protein n=1 Tax=Xenorhabdus doucetiae TaxID=351671 RepID=A0A068QNY2_9GAMM|nr:protein of unknown function [Xenorhabdus doucetiae]
MIKCNSASSIFPFIIILTFLLYTSVIFHTFSDLNYYSYPFSHLLSLELHLICFQILPL